MQISFPTNYIQSPSSSKVAASVLSFCRKHPISVCISISVVSFTILGAIVYTIAKKRDYNCKKVASTQNSHLGRNIFRAGDQNSPNSSSAYDVDKIYMQLSSAFTSRYSCLSGDKEKERQISKDLKAGEIGDYVFFPLERKRLVVYYKSLEGKILRVELKKATQFVNIGLWTQFRNPLSFNSSLVSSREFHQSFSLWKYLHICRWIRVGELGKEALSDDFLSWLKSLPPDDQKKLLGNKVSILTDEPSKVSLKKRLGVVIPINDALSEVPEPIKVECVLSTDALECSYPTQEALALAMTAVFLAKVGENEDVFQGVCTFTPSEGYQSLILKFPNHWKDQKEFENLKQRLQLITGADLKEDFLEIYTHTLVHFWGKSSLQILKGLYHYYPPFREIHQKLCNFAFNPEGAILLHDALTGGLSKGITSHTEAVDLLTQEGSKGDYIVINDNRKPYGLMLAYKISESQVELTTSHAGLSFFIALGSLKKPFSPSLSDQDKAKWHHLFRQWGFLKICTERQKGSIHPWDLSEILGWFELLPNTHKRTNLFFSHILSIFEKTHGHINEIKGKGIKENFEGFSNTTGAAIFSALFLQYLLRTPSVQTSSIESLWKELVHVYNRMPLYSSIYHLRDSKSYIQELVSDFSNQKVVSFQVAYNVQGSVAGHSINITAIDGYLAYINAGYRTLGTCPVARIYRLSRPLNDEDFTKMIDPPMTSSKCEDHYHLHQMPQYLDAEFLCQIPYPEQFSGTCCFSNTKYSISIVALLLLLKQGEGTYIENRGSAEFEISQVLTKISDLYKECHKYFIDYQEEVWERIGSFIDQQQYPNYARELQRLKEQH